MKGWVTALNFTRSKVHRQAKLYVTKGTELDQHKVRSTPDLSSDVEDVISGGSVVEVVEETTVEKAEGGTVRRLKVIDGDGDEWGWVSGANLTQERRYVARGGDGKFNGTEFNGTEFNGTEFNVQRDSGSDMRQRQHHVPPHDPSRPSHAPIHGPLIRPSPDSSHDPSHGPSHGPSRRTHRSRRRAQGALR